MATDLVYKFDRPELIYQKFDHVISIGQACPSAIGIRYANMRDAAYPFDWCSCGEPNSVHNAVSDEFREFLPETMTGPFNAYKIALVHLDPKKSAKENHEIYKRRCERFVNLLNSDKTILFVHSIERYLYCPSYRNNKSISDQWYEGICKFSTFLKIKFSHLRFQIIFIDWKYRMSTENILHVHVVSQMNLLCNKLDLNDPICVMGCFKFRELIGDILKNMEFKYNNQHHSSNFYDFDDNDGKKCV